MLTHSREVKLLMDIMVLATGRFLTLVEVMIKRIYYLIYYHSHTVMFLIKVYVRCVKLWLSDQVMNGLA